MLNVPQADSYTDFNALAKLKHDAKDKTPESIKEVAKQFESVFVGMMLKSMRQAKLADGILDSSQSEFYRDMYDQQLSVDLAGERGIGLADLIAKQLSPAESDAVVKEQRIGDYKRQALIRNAIENGHDAVAAGLRTESSKTHDSISKYQDITLPVVNRTGRLPESFGDIHSAEDFVNQLRPYAEQAAKKLGVDANILIAQAALETGWGQSVIKSGDGNSSYNLFNIKADKSWHGQKTEVPTLEFRGGLAKKEIAGFRSYASYQESFNDYVDFIKTNPRYKTALKMVQQPERYMHELQQAGYATDPNYAGKVMKIYQSKQLANQTSGPLAMKQHVNPDNS